MTKHIFVTGGVASSLGKGLTASSLGRLLKSRGLRVTMQKLDPYLNVDPGTMNPFEHGEVFVTDDGGETDLDLGHYERFIDEPLSRDSNATTGSIYSAVHRRRAPGRLPRQDRAGHPPHHRRDQAPHHPAGRRRRRRGDHRDRRHGRRHRDPPVPRGHPAVPPRRRPRQRLLPARHARAVHRTRRRAEDQAHPALRHRAAQPGHPARHHRVPQRGRHLGRAEAQDLGPVRRAGRGRHQRRRRPQPLRGPARDARRGPRRGRVQALRLDRPRRRPVGVGDPRRPGRDRPRLRCASGSSASTCRSPTPTCRSWSRSKHGGFFHARQGRDRVDPGRGRRRPPRRGPPPRPRRHRDPRRVRRARHRGQDRRRRPTPASTTSRASGCASACRS